MSFALPYQWITAEELAETIKASPSAALKDFAVVDVRSDDFVGGNIINCVNSPAETFHADVQELVQRLKDVPKVVFHCALSQQRGPKSARASSVPSHLKTPMLEYNIALTPQIYAEKRAELLPNAEVKQEVLVLRDGFSGFQAKYRNDPALIEKFNKRYHD